MNIVGQLCEETMKIEEYNSSWLRVLTATATIRFCHADGISPVPTVVVRHMFTLFMFAFSYFSIIVARCWSRPWSQKDEILPSQLYTVHAIHPYSSLHVGRTTTISYATSSSKYHDLEASRWNWGSANHGCVFIASSFLLWFERGRFLLL
jgi:hypothetical protein